MLKKRHRLTKAAFDQFFKSGQRYHTPLLQIIYTPADDFHGAVVVGKKVYKKAVDRNRLRRRLYGVLYQLMKTQTLTGIYIVIAKPAARETPYTEVRDALSATVGRIQKSR